MCSSCICMVTIKNSYNYTVQIIYDIIYIYIYIYDLKFNLDSLVFAPNNLFTTKIKNLDGYVTENWTLIEI